MSCSEIASFALNIVSIAVGVIAIWQAHCSEKRSKENYEETQKLLKDIRETTINTDIKIGDTETKLKEL